MIVIQDTFNLKYGKARDAKAVWQEMKSIMQTDPSFNVPHMMTDLTGQSYRLVMQSQYASLSEFENSLSKVFSNKDWQAAYQKFVPLIESGHREIFTLVE